MRIIGLVMAGGKGTRVQSCIEKPLLPVDGVPMIKRVINALNQSLSVYKIFVAVSPQSPKTKEFLLNLDHVLIIQTPGLGYHEDLKYAIKKIGEASFLVVSADLPLLSSKIVERIIAEFLERKKPSLTVMAPLTSFLKYNVSPTFVIEKDGKKLVPCGINLIDGGMIDESYIEESIFIINDPLPFINVNTQEDLIIVHNLLKKWQKESHNGRNNRGEKV